MSASRSVYLAIEASDASYWPAMRCSEASWRTKLKCPSLMVVSQLFTRSSSACWRFVHPAVSSAECSVAAVLLDVPSCAVAGVARMGMAAKAGTNAVHFIALTPPRNATQHYTNSLHCAHEQDGP